MDDNEFFVKIFKYCVTGFVVIVVSMIGSCQMTNYRIVEAVKAGAHPLSIECALTDDMCELLEAAEAELIRSGK